MQLIAHLEPWDSTRMAGSIAVSLTSDNAAASLTGGQRTLTGARQHRSCNERSGEAGDGGEIGADLH